MSTTGTAEAGLVGKQHAIIDMKQTFFRPVLISYSAACRYQSRCPFTCNHKERARRKLRTTYCLEKRWEEEEEEEEEEEDPRSCRWALVTAVAMLVDKVVAAVANGDSRLTKSTTRGKTDRDVGVARWLIGSLKRGSRCLSQYRQIITRNGVFVCDYGIDPQLDYFQVLEEARRHSKRGDQRPLDYLHFKLQKPISKDDVKSKNHRRGWWKSALAFWRRPEQRRAARGPYAHRAAVSGPLYTTESGGVGRRTCRPISGRLTATEFGAEAAGLAYLSLRELNQVDSRFVGLCFLVLHLSAKARFPASNRKGEGFRRQKERQKSDGMHADGRSALNRSTRQRCFLGFLSGELRQSYVRRASPSAFRVGARYEGVGMEVVETHLV
ncbi:hypothetical protein B296_00006846 [Ensete ventricosum]|uniref:Uncharacterized protein n=1 Tax=Ensete ventricosum TaxID=4639 RepID=A0A426Y9H9_ENSVE|nr:hypothetical protein B296_00006846 [Ensete ventricosum]